jgi:hypothetical protein
MLALAVSALALLASVRPARAGLAAPQVRWAPGLQGCEPPSVFYSPAHVPGARPCCATVHGLCPGGTVCPATGVCPAPEAITCDPRVAPARRNVILMIADDVADCHYGQAGECRSVTSGTPIPAPVTPNLDLLAGYGTVFPIAHNPASWCLPSLNTILTGRLQRSFVPGQRAVDHNTIPASLRRLEGDPNARDDPYDARNRIGGYCTLIGGKVVPGAETEFNARTRNSERSIGRTDCVSGAPGQRARCGSEVSATYDPFTVRKMSDIPYFLDVLLYRVPGRTPATHRMQNFFVWYAPRIPHQPVRPPWDVRRYLFGTSDYPLGGLFQLGAWCAGGTCPRGVDVMRTEALYSGTALDFYPNVWWMDDGVRELRKLLARMGAPHCIGGDGRSRFDVAAPPACAAIGGTWALIEPDLPRTTPIVYLADNGWYVPNAKHAWTENGYRTRLMVFDPSATPAVPDWDAEVAGPPPAPRQSSALAHAADVYPTVLGLALDSAAPQSCPLGKNDGMPCDGKDLRPFLASAAGGPQPAANLRRALCGHQTDRPDRPTVNRYLLTREGVVGRCINLAAPTCASPTACSGGQACVGGHCMPASEADCADDTSCPVGAKCLGRRCRAAPACVDDTDCAQMFPSGTWRCAEKTTRWCRNAPSVACVTAADCPACPATDPLACGRLCEPRRLKFYLRPNPPRMRITDLFLDPDETGVHEGSRGTLAEDTSKVGGPYARAARRASCCLDDWWPDVGALGSLCQPDDTCPADLTCD